MGRMRAREPKGKGTGGIPRSALPVRRHRNPVGIFSRAVIYP
jgi:hypothetical protein